MFILTQLFYLLTAALFFSVENTKKSTAYNCDKIITYTVSKIVKLKDNTEELAGFEIKVNPSAGTINLKIDHPQKGRVDFNTVITSTDCSLNATLTNGEATYKGYTVQPDGSRSNSTIRIKADSGKITITEYDPSTGRQPNYFMVADKWVITTLLTK
jgi:hypothetical protein